MVEILKTMLTSFKRSHVGTATLSARPCSRSLRPTLPLETPEHTWASLGHSLAESLLLSPGSWCAQGSVCALQKSISPVLRKFLWLYGGVNGDPLQEGLRHTQACCTQSPCPRSSPLLTQTPQEIPTHSSVSVSVGSLGLGLHKVCLSPLSISGGNRV